MTNKRNLGSSFGLPNLEEQIFPATFEGGEPGSNQFPSKLPFWCRPDDFAAPHGDPLDGLIQNEGTKMPDQDFDFRQLGHKFQAVTKVPTFSPSTTLLRLCGLNRSKTTIGILLSMQSENAVESITLSCFCRASR